MATKYQNTMAALAMLFLVGVCGYAAWQIQRYAHYKLGYESMVKDTVREMVRAEALKPAALSGEPKR